MESQFANLRQRDTSVSMLRVKMSRRRSQSQKKNRERVVNTRRQLDKLPEVEMTSINASIDVASMCVIEEKPQNTQPAKTEERLKQLERWKERKALEKEKRKREQKCVFKTGLYRPKDTFPFVTLPVVPAVPKQAMENVRVTRSMKRQPQVEKPLKIHLNVTKEAQHPVERLTRSRTAAVKSAATTVEAINSADVKTTKNRAGVKLSGRDRKTKASAINTTQPPGLKMPEKTPHAPGLTSCSEKEGVVGQASADSVLPGDSEIPNSFAPEGFVFEAPASWSAFKFEPLTPCSADAFLTSSFNLPPVLAFSAELPTPPKSPAHISPCASQTVHAPATPGSALESKHDVPYFRAEIASETDRLTVLCIHWESKVEDESIPEEMRDRMRTAVGQARLLMKERFNQFSGLVDDCELARGEKITTCTDLQGFWDMVYYQVEDVHKKFISLKEAEGRGWVEENKPPPKQRKLLKKQPAAPTKPTRTKAAAKSRLAAVKAAIKAKHQANEAERAEKDAGNAEEKGCLNSEEPQIQAEVQITDSVNFDGGLFKVESPAKHSGLIRRTSHLSAAVVPQASPSSISLTPQQPLALAQTSAGASPPLPVIHNPHHCLTLAQTPSQASKHHCANPDSCQKEKDTVNVSSCFTPGKQVISDETQPGDSMVQSETVSTQGNAGTLPELGMVDSFPPISIAEEKSELAEAVHLDTSPFSPYVTSSQPSISSHSAVQNPVGTQDSSCCSPSSPLVEEIPGLDFERYLQPSQTGLETLSPLAVDLEMESPRGHSEDLLSQQPAMSAVPSGLTLQSPQVSQAESALLLFTPGVKDQIRQSVCPSDLMVFTPPM